MRHAIPLAALFTLGLVGACAAPATPAAPAAAACSTPLANPPCGEINPRIVLEFPDFDPSAPLTLHAGESLTFEGTLTFTFNAGDEGFVPEDPNQPITITFAFPRRPYWADLVVEPAKIDLSPLNPVNLQPGTQDPTAPTLVYSQAFPVTFTVKALDEPLPTPGYPYAKLQVFAKSSESGIYNPGYGVKEVRLQADLEALGITSGDEDKGTPAPALLPLLALAVVALLGRRRP